LDHAAAEQFMKPPHRAMLIVEQQAEALLDRFSLFQPIPVRKWLDEDES